MDRRGSGFKKILGDYRKQSHYTEIMEPEFSSDYDAFFLILKNLNYNFNQETTKETTKETSNKMTEKLIAIIKENPNISVKEMAEKVGLTKDGVQYHIRNLKVHGVIEHVGPNKGGCWKVIKK